MIKVTRKAREACENDLDEYLECCRIPFFFFFFSFFLFAHSILPVSFSTISTRGSFQRRFATLSRILRNIHEKIQNWHLNRDFQQLLYHAWIIWYEIIISNYAYNNSNDHLSECYRFLFYVIVN